MRGVGISEALYVRQAALRIFMNPSSLVLIHHKKLFRKTLLSLKYTLHQSRLKYCRALRHKPIFSKGYVLSRPDCSMVVPENSLKSVLTVE